MSDFFELVNVDKSFGEHHVVKDVCISAKCGEVFSLLGPSGCGKTTILRIAGGFETPDSGSVWLDGKDVTALSPNKRKVNTVFQNYALFPHMTIWDNVAFGPRIAGMKEAEVKKQVGEMLEIVRMSAHADKRPDQISGGQKQRVAIVRALINYPKLLLLDEPLAALDLKLRQYMLLELDRIHDVFGTTFIYVTHDQNEAMSLSDHIAVMNDGRIEQVGTPAEIYENPATKFVASFIGDTNLFDATVSGIIDSEYMRVDIAGLGEFCAFNEHKFPAGSKITLSIRPERFRIFADKPSPMDRQNFIKGKIIDIIYQGAQTRYWVEVNGMRINVLQQHNRCYLDQKQPTWNDEIWIAWHRDDVTTLPKTRD